MVKPQHKTIDNLTTIPTRTTKHKRKYLLKERDRRRSQREQTKEQTILRNSIAQNTKDKAPIPKEKNIITHDRIKRLSKPKKTNTKQNTIRKEGSSTIS